MQPPSRSRFSDLRARARASWHELRGIPWVGALACDAWLVLGLALALIGADAPNVLWLEWWPLPMLTASIALALLQSGAAPLVWREFTLFAGAALLLLWRPLFSLAGPLPGAGLREAQSAATALLAAAALYAQARTAARRAWLAWGAALALNLLSLAVIRSRTFDYVPDLYFSVVALLGGATVVYFRFAQRGAAAEGTSLRMPHGIGLLALGWLCGVACTHLRAGAAYEQTPLYTGGIAYAQSWVQSLLLGWGRLGAGRIAALLAQPREALVPPWTGLYGLLAQWGLCGVALWLGAALLFLRRVCRPGRFYFTPPLARSSALLALGLWGWWLAAGPHMLLPLLIVLACSALALAPAGAEAAPDSLFRLVPNALAVGLAAVPAVLLLLPALGSSLLLGADPRMPVDRYRQRLLTAASLNPFDPTIPLVQANSLIRSMAHAEGFSEAAYQRVIACYVLAARLDSYDALIALRQARFQLASGRQEEALEAMKLALANAGEAARRPGVRSQPNSGELLGWMYATALQTENVPLAQAALDRALRLEPENPKWWLWQFELARRTGQAALRDQAQARLLTADPGDPAQINTALLTQTVVTLPQ